MNIRKLFILVWAFGPFAAIIVKGALVPSPGRAGDKPTERISAGHKGKEHKVKERRQTRPLPNQPLWME